MSIVFAACAEIMGGFSASSVSTSHLWLEVGVQEDITVWIDGEVVSVRADLDRKRQRAASHTERPSETRHFPSGMKLTVKRGVSFLMSPRLTSIPITPRISWFWCWRERWVWGRWRRTRSNYNSWQKNLTSGLV